MDTKTVSGRGDAFLQDAISSYQRAGWTVLNVERGTLGRISIVFSKPQPAAPPRPDR